MIQRCRKCDQVGHKIMTCPNEWSRTYPCDRCGKKLFACAFPRLNPEQYSVCLSCKEEDTWVCTNCGRKGHRSQNCPIPDTGMYPCKGDCGGTYPAPQFYHQRSAYHKGQWYRTNLCNDCHRKMQLDKYQNNIRTRLANATSNAKRRAEKKGWDFDIDINYLCEILESQQWLCHWSGIRMTMKTGPWVISLDRIDSNKGYTRDNVALCCNIVNRMKTNMTIEQLVTLCRIVIEHNST